MRSAAPIAGIAILACAGFGQVADNLVFEVASVKPSPPVPASGAYLGPARGGPGTADPGRITWTWARFIDLLMTAYDVPAYQISGPDWLSSERYDIHVRVPAGTTLDQVRTMWRSLLAERFGVRLHHESREFRVEELVVGKGGPKLKVSAEDPTPPLNGEPPRLKNGALVGAGMIATITPDANGAATAHVTARAQPLSKLTAMLTRQLGRPVLDKTGLTEYYDFNIDVPMRIAGAPVPFDGGNASDPGADIGTALQEQLGLRLIAGKATLDILVIDKADKTPTEN